jgi:thiol:disulfide interchange protein DsbC
MKLMNNIKEKIMKLGKYIVFSVIFIAVFSNTVIAKSTNLAPIHDNVTAVKTAVKNVLGLRIYDVKPTPIKGLFEVMTERGIFYSTLDAKYIVRGSLFDTTENFANLTELAMGKMRLGRLNAYEPSMIVYPAKNEKYKVTVFTDVDCGYCRKMHANMPQYNNLGITVRYMAFPRGGEGYPAWAAMQSLWCSDDQRKAMDELKTGVRIAPKSCVNKVPEHYQLGVEFGVNATPSLLLNDGTLLVGYRNPADLLKLLQ